MSDRYKALPQPSVRILGVPEMPEMPPAQIIQLWDLRHQDVSDATLALVNALDRDKALFPRPVTTALSAVLRADYSIGLEWIVDHFGAFSQIGRARIANSLVLPSAESAQLLVCLISDQRVIGYARSPELVPPFIDDRVCDDAYVVLWSMVNGTELGATNPSLCILPDMEYAERNAQITAFKQWWATNGAQVKAQLPQRLGNAPAVKQKLDALILQLSTP